MINNSIVRAIEFLLSQVVKKVLPSIQKKTSFSWSQSLNSRNVAVKRRGKKKIENAEK